MNAILIIGIVLSVLGLAGVIWCIRKAAWIRSSNSDDGTLRAALQKLIFVHMAAVGTAFMGLALCTVGMLLR